MKAGRFVMSLVVSALVISGCGGDSEVETDTSSGDDATVDDSAADDSTTDDSATDDSAADDSTDDDQEADDDGYVWESPLGEFLGWVDVDFNEEDAQAEDMAKQLRVEELTATCMREQGFEYIPVDPTQFMFYEGEEGFEGLEWGSEEFVRKYGFGITTQRFSQDQVGPDLVGHDWPTFEEQEDEFVDPNQDYVDSLTEPEREAYFEALHGGGFDDWPEPVWELEEREPTEEEIQEWEEWYEENHVPGCMEKASREVWEVEDEESYQEFDEEFGDLLSELYERLEASPEVLAYRAEVEACVSEQGYQHFTEGDEWMYFDEKLNDAGLGWTDPLEGVDTTGWTDEQFETAYREHETRPLPPDQLATLAELQEEEIGMAVALFECGGGWQNEQAILDPIRIEMERQFLEDYADELAPYEGTFGDGAG